MMDLPPALGAALRPVLPSLAEEIIAAIGREVPDYRRPLEGPFGQALRMGVENALARFVDAVEDPEGPEDPAVRSTYVGLGMLEQRSGRSLDALLNAYRLGARVAWDRFVEAGRAAGHEPEVLYRLAAAIFTYIDRISAESVEGWSAEQSASEAERGRRRRALARMLTRGDLGPEELRDAARDASWQWPAEIAALVVSEARADRLAGRLGGDAIGVAEEGVAVIFVPDPDAPGRHAQLRSVLGNLPAALGPTVPVERAAHSLGRARMTHALIGEGLVAGPLAVADEHLGTLLLHGDRALAADLAARQLGPLRALKPGPRGRLTETLRVWLDHPGQVQRVAADLHVHPQTVRYRVAQLRELLGDRLDDPDARFELALALRATAGASAS
jgi:hypothetical protein